MLEIGEFEEKSEKSVGRDESSIDASSGTITVKPKEAVKWKHLEPGDVNSKDINSEDVDSKDVNFDVNSSDVTVKESSSSDGNVKDSSSSDANVKDSDSSDINVKDSDSSDINVKDSDSSDVDMKDSSSKDVNSEDVNFRDVNVEDVDSNLDVLIGASGVAPSNANTSLSHRKRIRCNIYLFSATMMLDNSGREQLKKKLKKGASHQHRLGSLYCCEWWLLNDRCAPAYDGYANRGCE
jgi:hypothetical protein